MTNQEEITNTSISLEVSLLQRGRAKARERRQSFSAYVACLIENDAKRAKPKETFTTRQG